MQGLSFLLWKKKLFFFTYMSSSTVNILYGIKKPLFWRTPLKSCLVSNLVFSMMVMIGTYKARIKILPWPIFIILHDGNYRNI